MIRFTLFGVPVEIQPFFWVTSALIGGAHTDTKEEFLIMCLFIIAALISVLVHEFGHALTGRRLAGGYANIVLNAFGGLAFNRGGRFTRNTRFQMIAAGPGAGFAFLILILLLLCVPFHPRDVMAFAGGVLLDLEIPYQTSQFHEFFVSRPFMFVFLHHFLWINFWWGMINLLPIMPLDGGQIAELFMRSRKKLFLLGTITSAAMALVGHFWLGSFYMLLLFGFFAYRNYQEMREVRWE